MHLKIVGPLRWTIIVNIMKVVRSIRSLELFRGASHACITISPVWLPIDDRSCRPVALPLREHARLQTVSSRARSGRSLHSAATSSTPYGHPNFYRSQTPTEGALRRSNSGNRLSGDSCNQACHRTRHLCSTADGRPLPRLGEKW